MNYLRLFIFLIGAACFAISTTAQELKCTVTVNSDQVQGSNKEMFNTLKQSIEEFVNNSKWTNLTYQEKERIECNIMLVVKSIENNILNCEFTCQSRRPVFGTSYTTPILNFQDNTFSFAYQEFDRMDFQQNTFTGGANHDYLRFHRNRKQPLCCKMHRRRTLSHFAAHAPA